MHRELQVPGYALAVQYSSVPSTMDLAREWVGSCERSDSSAIFIAQEQTAGRGRQGRKWLSPPGAALMATFVFPCSQPISLLGGYSLAAGVGIVSSLSRFTEKLSLKWPNDIVSFDRAGRYPTQETTKKVGGILIEVIPKGSEHMISLGLGLNVQGVPDDLEREACSLAQIVSVPVTVSETLKWIAAGLLSANHHFMECGFTGVRERWCTYSCFTHGDGYSTYLTIDTGSEVIKGQYCGVTEIGSLLIQSDEVMREVHSGHILYWGSSYDIER